MLAVRARACGRPRALGSDDFLQIPLFPDLSLEAPTLRPKNAISQIPELLDADAVHLLPNDRHFMKS
jgi:hypothetical protein